MNGYSRATTLRGAGRGDREEASETCSGRNPAVKLQGVADPARERWQAAKKSAKRAKQAAKHARRQFKDAKKVVKRAKEEMLAAARKLQSSVTAPAPARESEVEVGSCEEACSESSNDAAATESKSCREGEGAASSAQGACGGRASRCATTVSTIAPDVSTDDAGVEGRLSRRRRPRNRAITGVSLS